MVVLVTMLVTMVDMMVGMVVAAIAIVVEFPSSDLECVFALAIFSMKNVMANTLRFASTVNEYLEMKYIVMYQIYYVYFYVRHIS